MILARPLVSLTLLLAFSAASAASPTGSVTWDGAAIGARSGGPFQPIFQEIQANVFTPNCTLSFCHGAAKQANLDLRDGAAYSNLVGVASVEVPDHFRVQPYDPDASYIICKLEACPWIVGSQMPIIGGPLSQPVIDVVRTWISTGALQFPPVSVESGSWGRVKALYRD